MKWVKPEINQASVKAAAQRYGIDLITASILERRKITAPAQVRYFLEDGTDLLHNPFYFEAMEDAVDRIQMALEEKEKVLIFGDSDTDGVTATTLLYEALKDAGLEELHFRVPQGEEPYGLSKQAVDDFSAIGGTLIITVDCGISNHEEVRHAAELGIDVIVCDHHKLQADKPPAALAVIDPKIEGCGYPFRDLAGAGVAWKLATAVKFGMTELYKQPLAILHISETQEADSEPTFILQAKKLHNLVPTADFYEKARPGSPANARILEKLSRFLQGRIILTWDKNTQAAAIHQLFGPSIDIEFLDIRRETALAHTLSPDITLEEAGTAANLARYLPEGGQPIDLLLNFVWKFSIAKIGLYDESHLSRLQLAALGTIADMMPLRNENRIIVKQGLTALNRQPRKGIQEILKKLKITQSLTATEIAWQITPLLNAAGRMGKPEIALQLLMDDNPETRAQAVENIAATNADRKKLGTDVWEALYPLAKESFEKNAQKFVLVGSAFIKAGITGLLASRLVGTFKVPAIVAAFKENGEIVGSIRNANNLKISEMLNSCSDLFLDFGGHDAAAGFSMIQSNWDAFVAQASDFIMKAELSTAEETLVIDAELPHEYLKPSIYAIFSRFEPFGEENQPIRFLSRAVPMVDAQIVGKSAKNHLKLTLDFGAFKWPALLWDGAERLERDFSFARKDKVDIVFKISMNRWNGEEKPQIEIFDIRKAEPAGKA